MILPIYLYGQPVLRKTAQPVTPDYPKLKELIANMKETMYASDGIGLAAPQVGLDIQLVYIDGSALADSFPNLEDSKLTLINPVITVDENEEPITRSEGCLSLPGMSENVSRVEKIHMTWVDEDFQPQEADFDGFFARIIQHECDHLKGTLYIDHVTGIRKQLMKGKLKKILDGKVSCDYRVRPFTPKK